MKDIRPFWDKVERRGEAECWPWTGYVTAVGRPLTQLQHVSMYASRKAWILTHGPIREDLCVNHRCDNALCCNPAHMYLGTRADNMIDLWLRTPSEARDARTPPRGRGTILTDLQVEQLLEMRRNGKTLAQCGDHFDLHPGSLIRLITNWRRKKLQRLRAGRPVQQTMI